MADRSATDLVIRASDYRAITPTQILHVLQGWRKPRRPDLVQRNAWSHSMSSPRSASGPAPTPRFSEARLSAITQSAHLKITC